MKLSRLTKRENQVMEVFWKYDDRSLIANDILNFSEGLSKNTLMSTLRNLYKNGYIDVVGVGFNKNSITREYKATITQAQYLSHFLEAKTNFEIAQNYINDVEDIEKLNQLEKLIQSKKLELKVN